MGESRLVVLALLATVLIACAAGVTGDPLPEDDASTVTGTGGGTGSGGSSVGTGGASDGGGGTVGAGISVSPPSGNTKEDGTAATFTVVLDAKPAAEVLVNFLSTDPTEGVLDVTQVSFTESSWDQPQTVTVVGQQDNMADGDQTYAIVFTPTQSDDPAYDGITPESIVLTNEETCAQPTGTETFTFTGMMETFVVPECVTTVQLKVYGAEGGSSSVGPSAGGLGGYAEGVLIVTPGSSLYVFVGEKGQDSSGNNTGVPGSFNGGGSGGTSIGGVTQPGGAAGGGASDVRYGGMDLMSRIIIAAGGGGSGGGTGSNATNGGIGGGLTGGPGTSYASGIGFEAQGATQLAGGSAGSYPYGPMQGTAGALGLGGNGHGDGYSGGGGGGGGLYGGGGGSCHFESGGGGGSSLIGAVMMGMTAGGMRMGHGEVTISW